MPKPTPKDYMGTRARIYRVSDGRGLSGWIHQMFGSLIKDRIQSDPMVQVGMHGKKTTSACVAALMGIGYQSLLQGLPCYWASTWDLAWGSDWTTLHQQMEGHLSTVSAMKSSSMRAPEISAQLKCGRRANSGLGADLAGSGMGVKCSRMFDTCANLELAVSTLIGIIRGSALIKSFEKFPDGLFGVGLKNIDLGMLDNSRWDSFSSELK